MQTRDMIGAVKHATAYVFEPNLSGAYQNEMETETFPCAPWGKMNCRSAEELA